MKWFYRTAQVFTPGLVHDKVLDLKGRPNQYLLLTAHRLLPTAYRLLLTAYRLRLTLADLAC